MKNTLRLYAAAILASCGFALPASATTLTIDYSDLWYNSPAESQAGWGVNVVRTRVGDRYVVEEMRKHGYSLGGEQSGHLVFLDHSTTGDGTLAALQLLAVMCRRRSASWPPSSSPCPRRCSTSR